MSLPSSRPGFDSRMVHYSPSVVHDSPTLRGTDMLREVIYFSCTRDFENNV
ncbi:predicted protein [Ostreococcus lucimarinus CCE9901]|uniref:Uncharacterized protein n=1 Tax=Ostreococcus lucimarinus (strain CCE9901) TaxID=436017 RepID=A4RT40_OSTLU|nr:predicted protein [Ostreococcus lucimarinus CCE9901]ABO94431.1 predicted protein [Ostreococcus lucimarinus CCE9901]|eukprot:XP_001416138.1 predicted protein [Ostreococcus lucimarinus CCE9901]